MRVSGGVGGCNPQADVRNMSPVFKAAALVGGRGEADQSHWLSEKIISVFSALLPFVILL